MSVFYEAVQAIIDGETMALVRLLRDEPGLARRRSDREHEATLMHYVAANGVEDDLQKTPPNAPEIAKVLLTAGADIDATAKFYGGGSSSTPLVALVTSTHPARAGVQEELVGVFCRRGGARVDGIENDGMPFASAISFFYPKAARALALCGARLDNIVYAAAIGDYHRVEEYLAGDELGTFRAKPFEGMSDREEILTTALSYAALGGHEKVVEKLLSAGVEVNSTSDRNAHQADSTALHMAAYTGQEETIDLLLEKGADRTLKDSRWSSTAAGWAEAGDQKHLEEKLS